MVLKARKIAGGKNLIDINNNTGFTIGTIVVEEGKECWKLDHASSFTKKIYTDFKPNTQYTIQLEYKQESTSTGYMTIKFVYSDNTSSALALSSKDFSKVNLTTTAGKSVVSLEWSYSNVGKTFFTKNTVQLEEGSTATSFEPYKAINPPKKGISLSDTTIRTLPNGVKDEIINGEYVKRVSDELVVNGANVETMYIDFSNTYAVYTYPSIINDALYDTNNSGIAKSADGDYGVVSSPLIDSRNVNLYSSSRIYIHVEKSKIDAMTGATVLDKFKAYLNLYPITLTYQLATSVKTLITPRQSKQSINLWERAGKPTSYNPLPTGANNKIQCGIAKVVLKYKAYSPSGAKVLIQLGNGTPYLKADTLTNQLTEYTHNIISNTSQELLLADQNSIGNIVIQDIVLVEDRVTTPKRNLTALR